MSTIFRSLNWSNFSEKESDWKAHTGYHFPNVEISDYNVMIDGKNFFDQSVKCDLRTYYNIWENATGQWYVYVTGCLLDYPYSKSHYKQIAINLSKQQTLDTDPKAMQQINFTWNLDRKEVVAISFNIEEGKETKLDFSKGILRVL